LILLYLSLYFYLKCAETIIYDDIKQSDRTIMDSMVSDALEQAEEEEFGDDGGESVVNESTAAESAGEAQPAPDSDGGMSDEELKQVADSLSTEITVVGCGGGGCNTVDRMVEEGIEGAKLVSLNTDVQHLLDVRADEKLLVGQDRTSGRGAGSLPQVGEESALEDIDDIRASISGSDMVFVTAGMGGGTGTGAAPVVAQAAQDMGALTIAIVTLPFTSEGEVRRQNAEAGLARLQDVSDTVIVIPNDKLLQSVGQMPIQKAFKVCDEVLMRSVKGITELITTPSIVNLDFSDVQTIMKNGGVAMIGLGETTTEGRRSVDAVEDALNSPLLDVDISNAQSLLVNVTGGPEMSIEEAEGVVDELYDRVDPAARIIWGTGVSDEIENTLRTMVVVTGVESEQIYGSEDEPETPQSTPTSSTEESTENSNESSPEETSDIDYVA